MLTWFGSSLYRQRRVKRHPSEFPDDEPAVIALLAVLQFHPRNARQACQMFTGTKMTHGEWRNSNPNGSGYGRP